MLGGALQGGDVDLSTQGGLGDRDGHLAVDVGTVTLEDVVRADSYLNDQISRRAAVLALAALISQSDALAVVDTGRDGDGELAVLPLQSRSAAFLAGGLDELARSAALLAGGLGLEGHPAHALDHHSLTRAAAVGTGLGGGAGLGTRAVAGGALVETVVGDVLLAAEDGLLKGQGHPHAHVVAPLGAVSALGAAAKAAAEDAAENIAEIAEVPESAAKAAAVAAARSRGGVKGRVAELVVLGLLVGVRQDGVGLVDLLEVLFRLGVAGVQVGMVFLGQLTVRPLDGVRVGALVEAQYLVVVSLCHVLYVPFGKCKVSCKIENGICKTGDHRGVVIEKKSLV